MNKIFIIAVSLLIFKSNLLVAQNSLKDIFCEKSCITDSCSSHKFNIKQLIAPVTLIGVGVIGLESEWVKTQNREIRNGLQKNVTQHISIDEYSRYIPIASVYALNLCNVKGKHNFLDRTVILATSAVIMTAATKGMKYSTKEIRPDGSDVYSFPSGHTALAFMGAEFLRMEYKDVSPWIGIAGYAVATGTGALRIYNNKHWLTDVLAGAGIGILSAKAAYWIFPSIKKIFYSKSRKTEVIASPLVSYNEKGFACVIKF